MRLKLPEMLQEAREKYGIEDGCFSRMAMFDRCFVWQIPVDEKIKGSVLIKSEKTKARERYGAPTGILISAGLQALDYLVTNGCPGLGARVDFVRLSPWRMPVDTIDGREVELVVCRATDLVGDWWLADALYKTGVARIVRDEHGRHSLAVGDFTYAPLTPETSDDY